MHAPILLFHIPHHLDLGTGAVQVLVRTVGAVIYIPVKVIREEPESLLVRDQPGPKSQVINI